MTIQISNRLVIIVGPSTSGKTTLSHKMKKDFDGNSIIISHDVVLDKINILEKSNIYR